LAGPGYGNDRAGPDGRNRADRHSGRGRQVLAYNAEFDETMLQQTCRRYSLPTPAIQGWMCVMELCAAHWAEICGDGFRYQSLGAACAQQGIRQFGPAHDAAGDALLTWRPGLFTGGKMSDDKALVPIDQRTVDFYGDSITAVLVDVAGEEQVYVPIRPICDFLGLSWPAQTRRIQRDPVLSDVTMSVAVTATDIDPESRRPRTSAMLALPLEYVNGFLFGINANRVKEEIREDLIRYQRECYHVLARAFLDRVETAVSPQTAALLQVREAVNQVIDSMIALERRQASTEDKLDRALNRAAAVFDNLGKRVTAVERQIRAGNLTEEQAREVQHRVNLIAQELAKRKPGEKHYPGIMVGFRWNVSSNRTRRVEPSVCGTRINCHRLTRAPLS